MSNGGKKGTIIFSAVAFVLGVIVSQTITASLKPFFKALEELGEDYICPINLLCPSHQTFKASRSVECQDGNVGRLIKRALNDGDLRSPQTTEEELAGKAYLCAGIDWPMRSPLEHLIMLETRFEGCFAYQPQTLPAKGSGKVEPKFSLQLGHTQACVARVGKPGGVWKVVSDDSLGRVFCFPEAKAGSYTQSKIAGLRRCTLSELKDIGMPEGVRNELANVRSQE